MNTIPTGACCQLLALTGGPRRLRGAPSLALPGLLSARAVPGPGGQPLTQQVRCCHGSEPIAVQIPPQSPKGMLGGTRHTSHPHHKIPWREGCSQSCWEGCPVADTQAPPMLCSACHGEHSACADQGVLRACLIFFFFHSEK